MSGKRFFVNKISDGKAELQGEDYSHVKNVLRLNEGDSIIVFNYEHGEFSGIISEINPKDKTVYVDIKEKLRETDDTGIKLTAVISVIKKDKMETVIEKLTELGVDRIVPVITNRSVVKIKDEIKKHERWEKIIYTAVKQCGRLSRPVLEESLDGIDKLELEGKKFMIWEKEENKYLIDEAVKIKDEKEVSFIIGPEGGFDDTETRTLIKKGFETVSIGKNILRAETAAISVAGVLSQVIRRGNWR